MESIENIRNNPILNDKIEFIEAVEEFMTFLETSCQDLKIKISALKESKENPRPKTTVKNYLHCQIFVLNRYIKRISSFEREVRERLNDYVGDFNTNNGNLEEEDSSAPSSTCTSPTPSSASSTSTSTGSGWSFDEIGLLKLMADMSKMKLRCKHILDVTDKYCVITRMYGDFPDNSNPTVVKSTVESFLDHLSVYGKTYTRRKSNEYSTLTL